MGGGAAGCYGTQGDDNNKGRGALDSAFRIHTAVLNWQHWLFKRSYTLGAGRWSVQ